MVRLSIHRCILTLLILVLGTILTPVRSVAASPATSAPYRTFPQTGHHISGPIKAFYEQNGDTPFFGLPLTEIVRDGELQVQYFERARFELHPDGTVALTRLGSLLTAGRSDPAFTWLNEAPAPDRTFFPESGHTLGGAFGWFWSSQGALAIFGYPISEEFVEDGRLVQYFERTRFEYHAEEVDAEVQLGSLGRDYAQRTGVPAEWLAPAPAISRLGEGSIVIPTSAQHNVALAAERIDGVEVKPGAELSFKRTVGEVSRRAGYDVGQAILDGQVVTSVGGGICYVSTALFRAVFLAGLPITERQSHSLELAAFNDIPGFDAAVDTDGPDLRWRNDTPTSIFITATLANGRLTVALWSAGDGRKTTMRGPSVRRDNETVTATISRLVVAPNGTLIRRDVVQSCYRVQPPAAQSVNLAIGKS